MATTYISIPEMLIKANQVVFIIIVFLPLSMAVLQQYLPVLQSGQQHISFKRDDVIERYFHCIKWPV